MSRSRFLSSIIVNSYPMRLIRASIRAIDLFTLWTGRVVSWLALLLVLVVVYDVFTRYVLSSSSVGVQELEWHLFALIFLLSAGWTLQQDKHVRVDVFYCRLSVRHKALINLAGGLLFLIPFSVTVIISSWPFVSNSFAVMESSPDPGGLPWRFLIKAAIPTGFFLLLLQGISGILRSVLTLSGQPQHSGI
ncbi:MAG: TRAP transporter small permease subunit [Prosthecochloris sp.]|uniref:Tripartite ATP-independent periplasmic transporter DctQ component n=2 Tax=Prosthecochloris aestuarii TaxID=1102 RepID=B4S4V1_PROA2|nr:TRAP transporter small permease subunit [Prosthecochloris sp.]ACF45449.1 Tripartite ATP-independent periplasmic transporter DctQ component [Prosthecochloris aestuarii DSM 271]MCW8797824.1 TRAP transporter small permease subunit [Prosthecochloris sp.]